MKQQSAMLLPLSRLVLALLFAIAIVIKSVDGNQNIVQVMSESLNAYDGKDYEDDNSLICCVYGNCSCSSLDHALANLTSNVLIDITTDVTLSSLVTVSDLENVSIIGHINPTVNCESVGGMQFTFIRHLIIQGITWIGCGTDNINFTKPGLSLSYSFNATIQNCTFQQSVGQAIVLSEMLGDVNINDCKFVNNSHYRGHGAAIHYSNISRNLVLAINNCNFSCNRMESLVYFENILFKYNKIIFSNSVFDSNQGTSIHAINHNISLNGEVLFLNNTAENGAGIYISDHSTVTFGENSDVRFIQNSANFKGGAVVLRNHSSITFDQNSMVAFHDNSVTSGTVYSDTASNVKFKGNCHVTFSGNSVTWQGATIYSDNSHVAFTGNSNVTLSDNYILSTDDTLNCRYSYDDINHHGGIIFSTNFSEISFEGSSITVFSNNTADYGGAIYSSDHGCVSFEGNSNTTFSNNVACIGGAIYHRNFSSISFKRNAITLFSNNTTKHGGAIYSYYYSSISFKGNSTTVFNNNTAGSTGGAIYSCGNSNVSFERKSTALFNNNTAYYGGAISSFYGNASFKGNSTTLFNDNTAYYGGALYSNNDSLSYSENSYLMFNNNTADNGGAVYSYYSSMLFEGNSTILFNDNTADYSGGAVYSNNGSLSYNGNSYLKFNNNAADYGGAVYSYYHSSMLFEGNSTILFDGNIADYRGGAVYSYKSSISCNGNSYLVFNNNTADYGGAVYSYYTNMLFEGNSTILFDSNIADCGGAMYSAYYTSTFLKVRSTTVFYNNTADRGGGICFYDYSSISFEENSTAEFNSNTADQGGAMYSYYRSSIFFTDDSTTVFRDNIAYNKGGVMILENAKLTFNDYSTVSFIENKATLDATIYCTGKSDQIMETGHPTVIFNDHIVNWCNVQCLSDANLTENEDVSITINSNGTVRCSGEGKTFVSVSRKCGFKYLEDILANLTSNELVNIFDMVIISSDVFIRKLHNISIIANKSQNVKCFNNAGLQVEQCSNITIKGLKWIECGADTTPVINILNSSDVTLHSCIFQQSKGQGVVMFESSGYMNINHCNFINNTEYRGHGAAIHYSSNTATNSQITFVLNNCNFTDNVARGYYISDRSLVYINTQTEDINISLRNSSFYNNHGISVYLSNDTLYINEIVLFESNYNAGIYIDNFSNIVFDKNSNVKFADNHAYHGATIFLKDNSSVLFDHNSVVTFTNNNATNGIIYSEASSNVIFKGTCEVTFSNNSATWYGIVLYSSYNSHVIFMGNSNVTFRNNAGKTIYTEHYSFISFKDNSTVAFHNNTGYNGGAIFSQYNSIISFEDSCTVTFDNNTALYSGEAIFSATYISTSTVTVTDYASVTFNNNKATRYRGAVYFANCQSMFGGNSVIKFSGNEATDGAAIYNVGSNSFISSFEFAKLTFKNNAANQNGGAIYCGQNQTFMLGGNSMVTFSGNKAKDGGAVYALSMYKIIFKENSSSTFSNNVAINHGGVIFSGVSTDISFMGTSKTEFNNNAADDGGTFYLMNFTTLTFNENAVIIFHNNLARKSGGVLYSMNTFVSFNGNSNVSLSHNKAMLDGAVMYCDTNCSISCLEFANVSFNNNRAVNGGVFFVNSNSTFSLNGHVSVAFTKNEAKGNGGVGYFSTHCIITLEEDANITFENNNALNGGVLYSTNSVLLFKGNSTVSLAHNKAVLDGGVMHCGINSTVLFLESTNVSFINNKAINGGGLFANNNSTISFQRFASVNFIKNEVTNNGGVGYFNMHCNITFNEYAIVTFENSNALYGGALCISSYTSVTFDDNSTLLFKNNMATNDGGAINILRNSSIVLKDGTKINFTSNNAQYGGAMFFDRSHTTLAFRNTEGNTSFITNTARIAGNNMYFDSTGSTGSCLQDRIIDITNITEHFIATPPSKLEFFAPATCINYHNKTGECNTYHLKHIMLGEEINVPVCVLNYCNRPSYSTPYFLLHGVSNQNYSISGSNRILISCNDTFQGISITSDYGLSKSSNYTIDITLHDDHSYWKQVSVNLMVELTSCYPGFWQYPGSKKCECYNDNDIVFCSGSGSTIKRGYWFGKVAEQPTVAICPVNYCNFTCCEASNGYYHLSPVRVNQCRSHRSGTACGSCTDGYTLSFDSTKCVNVDSCTAGQTILVILLTVTYWIVMVTSVFAMMYYKVPIGYLYSITYYYSIVDILLIENLYNSRGLYLTVSIISSFSKITPQFLGELCLTTGMSGIDQQFIHYIHPSAIIFILVIISLSARNSRRISTIISRGIIHVICLLLLLSYTSIASTSLLLMRPLLFRGIDIPYTYLSSDIEYFHGRHLAYGIVSLICIITIVVGLPLLLTLEPFLNHKFNFAKIKPLLDQFQGCYKDKCRCFAGYYMICRLLIITIVIVVTFNDTVANYLLITVSAIIALIQLLAKPYNNEILNKLDGVILQIMIFITALPLFDDLDSPSVITIIDFVLLFLPLLIIIVMTLYLHQDNLRKFVVHIALKNRSPHRNDVCSKNDIPMDDYQFIRDSSTRESVTVTLLDM